MDDRFTSGAFGTNNKYTKPEGRSSLGDFSVNIDSNGASDPVVAPRTKKFEVHIPDSYDVISEPEATTAARKEKYRPLVSADTAAKKNAPVRKAPAKPAKAQKPAAVKTPAGKNNVKKAPAKKKINSKRYEIVKNLLIACVCFIFISIITTTVSTVALGFLNDILVISDDTEYSAVVEIPEGATYDQVYDILCEKGLVRQPILTDIFLRFRHYDKVEVVNSETGALETKYIKYEPGVYYLNYSDGIENMIESIMVKTNYAKDTVRLTFPEGWTVAQIFQKLEKYGVCEAEKLYANLDIVGKQYGFISEIEADGGRYLTCEGYLFPDTYDFFVGESPSSVLKKLFDNFEAKWSDAYDARLKELGMTRDEIIIIASMIQKEAKDGSQMKEISGIIHNRLNDPASFPKLGFDSTSDYIVAINKLNVFSTVSVYNYYFNEYSTYNIQGLPPGPISNPGKAAINAALYPAETEYRFFFHDKTTGDVYYSVTDEEHERKKAEVLY